MITMMITKQRIKFIYEDEDILFSFPRDQCEIVNDQENKYLLFYHSAYVVLTPEMVGRLIVAGVERGVDLR